MDLHKKGKSPIDSAPTELIYAVGEKELADAKFTEEETRRAWQEEHDARIEAEEAKAAVIKSAEDAIEEANELKKKLARELEEAKLRAREALQARKLYEEARAQTEEAEKIWIEACRARKSGRSDDRLIIEAREAEQREEYILKWLN